VTPEGEVKKAYRELIDTLGYRFSPVQTGWGKRTLDDLCCIRGRFVAIEGKRVDNAKGMKPFQAIIADEIRAAGGLAFPARSVDEVIWNLRQAGLL
jgi:hypothetical protein